MGTVRQTGDAWQQELRARGYRLTPQRRRVLEAVGELGHGTPEEIAQRADGVNLSTVYRTLELLEELGLVKHTHLSHGSPSFSVAGPSDHVHLVCRDCGGVIEVDASLLQDVERSVQAENGFAIDLGHVALFGSCRQCTTA